MCICWCMNFIDIKIHGTIKKIVLLLALKNNGIPSTEIKLIRNALNRTVYANSRRVFQ